MSNIAKPITLTLNLTGAELASGSNIYNLPGVQVTASITDTDSYDNIILWDFGDGTKIKGKSATHSYSTVGQYDITCTLFDADGIPVKNTESFSVNVIQPFETYITYTGSFKQTALVNSANILAGQQFEAGSFIAYNSADVNAPLPIICNSNVENTILPAEIYHHLIPTFNFYKDGKVCSEILPAYCDAYISFSQNTINLYILNLANLTEEQLIEINLFQLLDGLECKKYLITDLTDITEEYYYIGKVGFASVDYRADYPVETLNLSFVFNKDYLPTTGILNNKAINLVSLSYTAKIGANIVDNSDKLFYSINGLTTNSDISLLSIADNKYSFNNAKYVGVQSPLTIRIISQNNSQHFIKDFIITDVQLSPINLSENIIDISYELKYNNMGSTLCYITANEEIDNVSFELTVTYQDIAGNTITKQARISDICFIDLNSFTDTSSKYYLDPVVKHTKISGSDIWDVYKTHAMFDSVPRLDTCVKSIFDQGNLMQNIVNKGYNFVDDFGNIETANVKALISLFSYLGITTELYDIDNFAKPGVINRLMQIFSIKHSKLIGTTYTKLDEFVDEYNIPGKNLGEELNKYSIVYLNGENWPVLVAYDKFAKQYIKINTILAKDSADMQLFSGQEGKLYFNLNNYTKNWGWGLLANDIDELFQLYNLYYYKDTTETDITGSYLEPDTISDNIKDYNTWIKTDGSMDRLLYKTFIETLGLNKS